MLAKQANQTRATNARAHACTHSCSYGLVQLATELIGMLDVNGDGKIKQSEFDRAVP